MTIRKVFTDAPDEEGVLFIVEEAGEVYLEAWHPDRKHRTKIRLNHQRVRNMIEQLRRLLDWRSSYDKQYYRDRTDAT